MTILRLRDGAHELVLSPATGYHRAQLDVGSPAVRAVTQSRPGQDGEDDTTAHFGAAAVSLQVLLEPAPGRTLTAMVDALRRFCHPAARPFLILERDGSQRRIRLRADQTSSPITSPTHQRVQVSWRAPDGVMESAAEQVGTATATTDMRAGRVYPRSYPLRYASSSPLGAVTVVNDGTAPTWPVLRLYGPVTDPRVENQTTGERLLFTGLSVAAGDWLEVDCRERTVLVNGLPGQSRLSRLSFVDSEFLTLQPGSNTLRYFPPVFAAGARLEVRYRSAWL